MFLLHSTLALANNDWSAIDAGKAQIHFLLYDYTDVVFTIEDTDTGELKQLGIRDIPAVYDYIQNLTMDDYLSNLTDYTPTWRPSMSMQEANICKYIPLPENGLWHIESRDYTLPEATSSSEDAAPLTDAKLVVLRGTEARYQEEQASGLFVVNGYIHNTTATPDGLLVQGAVSSISSRERKAMGKLDFSDICTLSTYPICSANFQTPDAETVNLANQMRFLLPDGEGKSYGLVLGGILHLPGPLLKVEGDSLYFNTADYDWRTHYQVASEQLGWDTWYSEDYGDIGENDAVLFTDECLLNLVYSATTFVVAFDAPAVHKKITLLDNIAGDLYKSTSHVGGIVSDATGRILPYTLSPKDDGFTVTVDEEHLETALGVGLTVNPVWLPDLGTGFSLEAQGEAMCSYYYTLK